jgi:dATP pyrophosphohydrolase
MARPAFRRPESVLVVVHSDWQVLLLERCSPEGFWQSVTGSLRDGESPGEAARRELAEETGFPARDLVDLGLIQRFSILPEWQHRYAPGVSENVEHAFAVRLACAEEPRLNPAEHLTFRWLAADEAAGAVSSWTNRAAIEQVFSLAPGRGRG